jgi:MFS transporter, FSR family, fosmidomycin resistance protein
VGLSMNFSWKSNTVLLIILTCGIAMGKGFGGILADYFGWIKIVVSGLTLSAFLLLLGKDIPVVAILGMFLFNLSMPVTLVAISNIFTGRPGFSFGLTTLALLTGALPTFFRVKVYLSNIYIDFGLVIIAVILLFGGLKLYRQNQL